MVGKDGKINLGGTEKTIADVVQEGDKGWINRVAAKREKHIRPASSTSEFFRPYIERAYSLREWSVKEAKTYLLHVLSFLARIDPHDVKKKPSEFLLLATNITKDGSLSVADNEGNPIGDFETLEDAARELRTEDFYRNVIPANTAGTHTFKSAWLQYIIDVQGMEVTESTKVRLLRTLGENILGMVGFFPEFLEAKADTRNHKDYAEVGALAYKFVAENHPAIDYSILMIDVAANFGSYAATLTDVRLMVDDRAATHNPDFMDRKQYLMDEFPELTGEKRE